MQCLSCQTENSDGAKFCMQCGVRLGAVGAKGPAERRQITVLFCDLVGSTALSEELDPEDLRDVIRRYHSVCETVVNRYGGSIAQHLGDGVLVYFGHPNAHEDDTLRAVWAGLELRRAVAQLSARGRPLSVRVGMHTGVVVVGSVGAESRQLALGATPNLAARIQQEAEPDTVVMSEASYRLVVGFFESEDLGLRTIRGVSQPVRLYRVEKESGAKSRMEATATVGLTPFVGREREIASIGRAWEEVLAGRAQVVALSGEPGIGKSRLVRALRETVDSSLVIEAFASPLFQDTAMHPIVEMLERRLGLAHESAAGRRNKLRAELAAANIATPDTIRLLESLLSIALPEDAEATAFSPQKQRQATFDALAAWLRALADRQPVLFVVEDMHWADPSTIELLGILIERNASGRLMLMLTHRPEFVLSLSSPRLTQLTLFRMPPEETRQILATVVKDRKLPEEVEREVLEKADGVPLYVEEITKAVLESRSSGPLSQSFSTSPSPDEFAIPATVVDSLIARLDRLGEAKKVVQLAATLGRTFTFDVLLDVAGTQETALRSQLNRLEAAGLLHRKEQLSNDVYIFKHALIQDAAYGSLLRTTRQEYHWKIARVLRERFPSLVGSQPELLARHFAGAGMATEAIEYWALAGQTAIARSANAEAISAFGNALHLLSTLPASERRDRQEIELRCGLGFGLISSRGWSAKEVEETYGPAHELCRRFGDVPLRVMYGMWAASIARSDRDRTAEMLPKCEHVVRHSTDRPELLMAHSMLAARAFYAADYSTAHHHCDLGKAYIDREHPRKQALDLFSQGYDGQLYPLIFKAWAGVYQGHARETAATTAESIDIGRDSGHPYLFALALSCGAASARDMRDIELTDSRAQRLSQLASEHHLAFFSGNALCFHGWVAFERRQHANGLNMLQRGVAFYQAVGADFLLAYYLSWLAEAYLSLRRLEDGLVAVNQGLELTRTKLSVFAEPELHRLKGELLILKGDFAEAEQCLRTSHGLAIKMGATLFEARASLSIGRLWGSQGRGADAVPLLRESLRGLADEPLVERRELIKMREDLGCAL